MSLKWDPKGLNRFLYCFMSDFGGKYVQMFSGKYDGKIDAKTMMCKAINVDIYYMYTHCCVLTIHALSVNTITAN